MGNFNCYIMNSTIFSGLKKLTLLLFALVLSMEVFAQVLDPFRESGFSSYGVSEACPKDPVGFEVMGVKDDESDSLSFTYEWFTSYDGANTWKSRGTLYVPTNVFEMGQGDLYVRVVAEANGKNGEFFTRTYEKRIALKAKCDVRDCYQTTTGEYYRGTDFNYLYGSNSVNWWTTPPEGLEEHFTEQGIIFRGLEGRIMNQSQLGIPLHIDDSLQVNPNNNFYVQDNVNREFFTIAFPHDAFEGKNYRFTMRFYMIVPANCPGGIDSEGKMIARTGHGTQTKDTMDITIYNDKTNQVLADATVSTGNDATKFVFGGIIANSLQPGTNVFRFEMTYYGYMPQSSVTEYIFTPFFEQFPKCATLAVDYISAEVEGVCLAPRIACLGETVVVNAEGFRRKAPYEWKKYKDGSYTEEIPFSPGEVTYDLDRYGQKERANIVMLEKGVFYYALTDGHITIPFALGGRVCTGPGTGIEGDNICAESYPHTEHYKVRDLSKISWIKENGDDYVLEWKLTSPTGLPESDTKVSLTTAPDGQSVDIHVGDGAMKSSSYNPNQPYMLHLYTYIKEAATGTIQHTPVGVDSAEVWIYDQPDVSRLNFTTKSGDDTICAATSSDTILLEHYQDVAGYRWHLIGATMTNDSVIHIDGYDKEALCNTVDGVFPVALEVVNGACRASMADTFTMHGIHAPSVDCSALSQPSEYTLRSGQLDTTIFLPIPKFETSCDDDPAVHVRMHYDADENIHDFDSTYTLHKKQLDNLQETALTLFSGVGDVHITITDGCGRSDSCSYKLVVKDVDTAIVDCSLLEDYNVKVSSENGCVARPGRDLDIKEPYLRDLTFLDTTIMLKGVYSGRSQVMKAGMSDPGLDPANYSMDKAMTDDYEVGTTFILWNFVDPAGHPSYCHSRVNVKDSVEMFKCDSLQTIRSIVNRNPHRVYRYASAQAQSTVNPDTDYKLAGLLTIPQSDTLYCGDVKLDIWFTGMCVDDNGDSITYAVDSVITGEQLLKHRFPIGLTTVYYRFSSDVFDYDTQKYDTVLCSQEVIISSGGPTTIDCPNAFDLATDSASCSAPSPFTKANIPTGKVSYFCETKYTYDACSGTPYDYENLGISEKQSRDYDTITYPIKVVRMSNLDSTYALTSESEVIVCDNPFTKYDSVPVKKVQHRNGQFETVCAEDPIEQMALKVTNFETLPSCVADSFSRGYHKVLWIFNNGKGDLDTCETPISVTDRTAPDLDSVCKDPEMQVFASKCEIPYEDLHLPELKAYDACDGYLYPELIAYVKQKDSSIIVYRGDEVRSAMYPTEVHKFVWLFTDKAGNQDSCVTYLDVVDSVALSLEGCEIYGDTIPFTLPEGECTLDPSRLQDSLTFPRAIDICDKDTIIPIIERRFNGELVTDGNGNPIAWDAQPFPLGTTNLKWIFIDKRGIMKDSCEKNVKVRTKLFDCASLADTVKLELMEKFYATAEEVRLAGLERPTITIDACHAATIDFSRDDGLDSTADYQIGNTTVFWTFNYVFEEVKTCHQVVKIIDMVPIEVKCPPIDTSIHYECYGEIPTPYASVEEFLNAGGYISEMHKYKEGSFRYEETERGSAPCDYELVRTYYISDIRDQLSSCDQIFTITDVTSPVIHTRLDTIKIACDQDSLIEAALQMDDIAIDASDNCSKTEEIEIIKSIQKNRSEDIHDCSYNNYTIWRTWVAKDKCGNMSSPLVQVVLVVDSVAPRFVLPDNFKDTVLASNIKHCTMTVPPLYTNFRNYVQDGCTDTEDIDIWQVPAPGVVITEDTEVWIYSADKCGNKDSLKMFARVMKPQNVVSLSAKDLTICATSDSTYIDLWSQDARFASGYVLVETAGKIRSIPSTFVYDCYRESISPSNILFSDNRATYFDRFYVSDKVKYDSLRIKRTRLNRYSQSGTYVFVVMDTTTQCADTAYSYLSINEKPRINMISRERPLCEDDTLDIHLLDSITSVCVDPMGSAIKKEGWVLDTADYVRNTPVPYLKKEIPVFYFAENECGRTRSDSSLFTTCGEPVYSMEDSLKLVGNVDNLKAWRDYKVFRRDSVLLDMHERFVRDSLVLSTDPLGITRCYVGDEIVLSVNTHHYQPVFYSWYKVLNGFDGDTIEFDKEGALLKELSEELQDSILYRDFEELHTYFRFIPVDSSKYYVLVGDGVCPAVPSNLYNIDVLTRVPTAFTPYVKDGFNDIFLERRQVVIFDRYGQKVFEGMDGWDGTDYNGRMVDPGVFFYEAVINGVKFKGTIEVVYIKQ